MGDVRARVEVEEGDSRVGNSLITVAGLISPKSSLCEEDGGKWRELTGR